jgi:8-oxo-dGTP diphosphatase
MMSKRVRHQISAAVFVALIRDGAVCLLRRAGTGWMDGHFSLPAGTLEADETIRSAAVREVKEEIGVDLDPADLRHSHLLHSLTEGSAWTGHFFVATRWSGEPKICEPDKHGELRWFSLAHLPADIIPYVRQALAGIGNGQPYSEFGWEQVTKLGR